MKKTIITILLAALACAAAAGDFEKQAAKWNESVVKDAKGAPVSTNKWGGAEAVDLQAKIAAQAPDALAKDEARFLANRANLKLTQDASQDAVIEAALRKMSGATNHIIAMTIRAPLCARFASKAEVDLWLPGLLPPLNFNAAWAAAIRLSDDSIWTGLCKANLGTGFSGPAYQNWFRANLGALTAAEVRKALIKEIRGLVKGGVALTPEAQEWLRELRLKLAVTDELKDIAQ